jgi:hypothetical protein
MLDLKAVEERPEGLVHGPPQAMSVPHLPFAIQTNAVFFSFFSPRKFTNWGDPQKKN